MQNKEMLVNCMKRVLADTFVMYYQVHSYHWNVTGKDFHQHHAFFGNLYEELYEAVDVIAEQVRALDAYAPISLNRIKELSRVSEDDTVAENMALFVRAIASNDIVVDGIERAYKCAQEENCYGLASFLETRLDAHAKHRWMLKSHFKTD